MPQQVAWHYARGMLLFDIVTSTPVSMIEYVGAQSCGGGEQVVLTLNSPVLPSPSPPFTFILFFFLLGPSIPLFFFRSRPRPRPRPPTLSLSVAPSRFNTRLRLYLDVSLNQSLF